MSNKQPIEKKEKEKEKIMSKEKPVIGTEGIYDARALGAPRMLVLGIQHMFAMFGATVLVPVLTGLSVTTTLLFAGLGTLLFHLLAKGKVPAFLGSSFAFLAGYQASPPRVRRSCCPTPALASPSLVCCMSSWPPSSVPSAHRRSCGSSRPSSPAPSSSASA